MCRYEELLKMEPDVVSITFYKTQEMMIGISIGIDPKTGPSCIVDNIKTGRGYLFPSQSFLKRIPIHVGDFVVGIHAEHFEVPSTEPEGEKDDHDDDAVLSSPNVVLMHMLRTAQGQVTLRLQKRRRRPEGRRRTTSTRSETAGRSFVVRDDRHQEKQLLQEIYQAIFIDSSSSSSSFHQGKTNLSGSNRNSITSRLPFDLALYNGYSKKQEEEDEDFEHLVRDDKAEDTLTAKSSAGIQDVRGGDDGGVLKIHTLRGGEWLPSSCLKPGQVVLSIEDHPVYDMDAEQVSEFISQLVASVPQRPTIDEAHHTSTSEYKMVSIKTCSIISTTKPPQGDTTTTMSPQRMVRRSAVAIGGSTMVGIGTALLFTPIHPLGHVVQLGGLTVLGRVFETPRNAANALRDRFNTVLFKKSSKDDSHEDEDPSHNSRDDRDTTAVIPVDDARQNRRSRVPPFFGRRKREPENAKQSRTATESPNDVPEPSTQLSGSI